MTENSKKTAIETKVPTLTLIQNELKVPKNQDNPFQHFKYSNAEDIEYKLKPLLKKYGAKVHFNQDIRQIGDRFYVVAIMTYEDDAGKIEIQSLRREPDHKTKMDDAQVTGSSYTYAVKGALSSLFLVANDPDPDSQDNDTSKQDNNKAKNNTKQLVQPAKTNSKNERKYYTQEELKQLVVTVQGKKCHLHAIVSKAMQGNQNAINWLNSQKSHDILVAIKQMKKIYTDAQNVLAKQQQKANNSATANTNKAQAQPAPKIETAPNMQVDDNVFEENSDPFPQTQDVPDYLPFKDVEENKQEQAGENTESQDLFQQLDDISNS